MTLPLFAPAWLNAQEQVKGVLLNEENGNAVPFVHIVPLGHGTEGTQSDLEGSFSLEMPRSSDRLVLSSLGYVKDTVMVQSGPEPMRVELQEQAVQKKAVEVRPGKNPAIPIIRKAIARRELHDPLEQEAFRYSSYNKIVYSDRSLAFDSTWTKAPSDSLDPEMGDSSRLSIPDSIHGFLMETVTERKYLNGRFDKKEVSGARVSGFKDPPFIAIASEFQEISFYRNYIKVFGSEYRSPISKGALKKYEYRLRNTLVEGTDSTFFIGFRPKAAAQLKALSGMLTIGSESYAIRSIRAKPIKQGPNPVRIEQSYRLRKHASFPEKMNFEFRLPAFGTIYNGMSYLRNIELGKDAIGEVGRKDLSIQKKKGLDQQDSAFWDQHRPRGLTQKDSNTYQTLDSLGKEQDLDRKVKVMEELLQGRFPFNGLNLRLYELYRYNTFERNRLGVGLETNDDLSSYFRIGGYWGYGTGDARTKFGADLDIRPTGTEEWRIGLYYRNDLIETARYHAPRRERFFATKSFLSGSFQRGLYMRRMLASEELGFRFRTDRPRYLTLGFWSRVSNETPLYSTPYLDRFPAFQQLRSVETAFRFRFAYGEGRTMSFGQKMRGETPYPVLTGRMVKGWKGLGLGGDRTYWRVFGRLEHDFLLRGLGKGKLTLDLGASSGNVPLSRLYYAPGAFSRDLPLFVDRSFNTADRYEFLHSRFAHVFYDQELLRFTLHESHSRPLFRLRHHMGWGDRSGFRSLGSEAPSTMKNGYFESGITVQDLLYTEVEGLYYYGVGISAAYRYGAYSRKELARNLAYGVAISFGF